MTYLLIAFVVAAATDWMAVKWHREREAKRAWRTTILSMVIEAMNWAPIWAAVQLEDWRIMVACILGSGVGTRVALKGKGEASDPVQDPGQVLPRLRVPVLPVATGRYREGSQE